MSQRFLPRGTRLFFATLGAMAVLAAASLWLMPHKQASSGEAEPSNPKAAPAPLYADIEPARNPRRLCVQDDGRKVLGWV